MQQSLFPRSQGELIKRARGDATQAEFSRRLGVDRSCLSRYESEALGAPTSVINACLTELAAQADGQGRSMTDLESALAHAKQLLADLEAATRRLERAPKSKRQD